MMTATYQVTKLLERVEGLEIELENAYINLRNLRADIENERASLHDQVAIAALQGLLSCTIDHKVAKKPNDRVTLAMTYADEYMRQRQEEKK